MKLGKTRSVLLGTALGDMLGISYEYPVTARTKDINFAAYPEKTTFSDDTIMTIALAKYFLEKAKNGKADLAAIIKDFVSRYPKRGYGKQFLAWCEGSPNTDSFGNGAAMRIAPAAYVARNLDELFYIVHETTTVTHTNKLALDYAMATAIAIYGAARGATMAEMRQAVNKHLASCQEPVLGTPASYDSTYEKDMPVSKSFPSVPQALACFFYTEDVEMAMRTAVACARDADTQAAIAGSIALPFYCQFPGSLLAKAPDLPEEFMDIIDEFSIRFKVPSFNII